MCMYMKILKLGKIYHFNKIKSHFICHFFSNCKSNYNFICHFFSNYKSNYKKPEINSGNKKGEGGIRTPGPD